MATEGDDVPESEQYEPEAQEDSFADEGFGYDTLARVYQQESEAARCKTNYLVTRSLLESFEAGQETFSIAAPGCHPMTFSSRLGDADMEVFVRVFGESVPFLSQLDLSNNNITDRGAEQLARGLLGPRAARLQSLSLRANSVGPRGCEILCEALQRCPILQSVDVSRNPLGRVGGLALVSLLQKAPRLGQLWVADAELDIDVLVAIADALLPGKLRLGLLDVENPRIGTLQEEHTVHLGRMLRTNPHLSEIRLGKHKMRDEGVRQLVSFLVENKTLRVLDLRCNELGADGARHLGVLLSSDCQLTLLNLSSNRIGEKANVNGAEALAKALLANRMLRALDLNCNELCGEALQLLAEAVDQNSTLEVMALFHNQWNQASSLKFHRILNDRSRLLPFRADFVTSEVDERIDICKLDGFDLSPGS